MTSALQNGHDDTALARARSYLCVDAFIADMAGACALSTAFETGVVDHLAQHPGCTLASLQQSLQLDTRGTALLLEMLTANRVTRLAGDQLWLTDAFQEALVFRDLLEAKLHFARVVAPDFLHLLTALLMEPAKFVEHARLFKLFSYQQALTASPENYEHTARWMRLTTALTRYEADVCIALHDFSSTRRLLDVGGNSGEFVLRICKAVPQVQATVYDLPLVCDIGAAHVAAEPEAARIGFVRHEGADRSRRALPAGHDLISFKSMLHDWPDAEMDDFLARAHAALETGGTLLIFERGELNLAGRQVAYGQLPLMLFFRSYRQPDAYCTRLEALGFQSVQVRHVELDMPFMLITAVK
ncbi:MAG: methyltransferase [Polaromonas sp.]|nr:methyltransferase [Polaromonas sp.]